ncbi:homeobox protein CDX-4 [Protopterus annectens]|uniref:homeobox protein CDX-4 n=1 Tax=Protopterus annectens TaxID=7888 RepID=UPI001CFB1907|nr:homeobox protein CDX-4 [Protopterus annectens]
MYVSYLLEKETSMYPGSLRRPGINLPPQNFASAAQYSDYNGYHQVPNVDCHHSQPSGVWGSAYGPPRDDWNTYAAGPSGTTSANPSPGQVVPYSPPDYGSMHSAGPGILSHVDTINGNQISPSNERHESYDWMRKTAQSISTGKTRTKEKYRVVYTDHQRLELEKEFHSTRYITIRRKSELAVSLGLSERQVKIWFQNRRAKERKLQKKRLGQSDGSGGSTQSDQGSLSPILVSGSGSPIELVNSFFPPPPRINNLNHLGGIQQVIID